MEPDEDLRTLLATARGRGKARAKAADARVETHLRMPSYAMAYTLTPTWDDDGELATLVRTYALPAATPEVIYSRTATRTRR